MLKGRTDLAVMWLEHLLLLSMLQHASGTWSWGRYVVVHLAPELRRRGCGRRYRVSLVDESTFSSVTIEGLLEADVLPARTTAALRDRYLATHSWHGAGSGRGPVRYGGPGV